MSKVVWSSLWFWFYFGLILAERFNWFWFYYTYTQLKTALVLLCRKAIGFAPVRFTIGLKSSCHFFIQSKVKPKPIVTRPHSDACSRALPVRQLHLFTMSFDWFIGLSASFGICHSDDFGIDLRPLLETRSTFC